MEDREADQIGLEVGDTLTFDIQGQQLEAELTGIYRQQGLQTRFWFEAILSDGVLDPFISRYVAASYMPTDNTIAAQNEIAEMAYNVVSVRTATIVATAKDPSAMVGVSVRPGDSARTKVRSVKRGRTIVEWNSGIRTTGWDVRIYNVSGKGDMEFRIETN